MRRGNKTKWLVALLTAALALNAFALAPIAGMDEAALDEAELVWDFDLVPNENLPAEEEIPEEAPLLEENLSAEALSVDEAEVQAAADEEGQIILPGKVFEYNGKMYKIDENATNIMSGGGSPSFDDSANFASSGEEDVLICGSGWQHNPTEGHVIDDPDNPGTPGCVQFSSGALWIWRHTFDPGKLYVMSMWYKFDNGANLDDGNRIVRAALDVDTGSDHYVNIGKDSDPTGGWQQDLCVFNGASGERRCIYLIASGTGNVYWDDLYIFECSPIESMEITGHDLEDDDTFDAGFTEIPYPGRFNHYIYYTSNTTQESFATGVMALFKDGKLEKINTTTVRIGAATYNRARGTLRPYSGYAWLNFEIPEGEDVSRYSYMAYLVDEGKPFSVMGEASEINPARVNGAQ